MPLHQTRMGQHVVAVCNGLPEPIASAVQHLAEPTRFQVQPLRPAENLARFSDCASDPLTVVIEWLHTVTVGPLPFDWESGKALTLVQEIVV
jgi:hypothetical protein